MSESSDLKKWLLLHGYKFKIIYSFAVVHKLDIQSRKDVLNILRTIDPKNATERQADIYSKMLQLFRTRFRKTVEEVLTD